MLLTILTYIWHVTLSAFFSIDCLEVKVILLACFEISYAAGKYLVVKYAHNAYKYIRRSQ